MLVQLDGDGSKPELPQLQERLRPAPALQNTSAESPIHAAAPTEHSQDGGKASAANAPERMPAAPKQRVRTKTAAVVAFGKNVIAERILGLPRDPLVGLSPSQPASSSRR